MRTKQARPLLIPAPAPRPFPTRGVPGGWRDPWDGDPRDALLGAARRNAVRGRVVGEAGQRVELGTRARGDGRWEAHVVAWDRPPGDGSAAAPWPSVNGPTATAALDALEAELRELIRGAPAVSPGGTPARADRQP